MKSSSDTPEKITAFTEPSFKAFSLLSGVLLIVISIVFFSKNIAVIIPVLILITGLLQFLALRFISIDVASYKIRDFILFFPFKIGKWESIYEFESILLTNNHGDAKIGIGPIYVRDMSFNNFNVLLLHKDLNKRPLLLLTDLSLPKARQKAEYFSGILQMEFIDQMELNRLKYKNKRY